MKKVKSTKDLPKWFKLANYDYLLSLSDDDIAHELICHESLFCNSKQQPSIKQCIYSCVFNGEPNILAWEKACDEYGQQPEIIKQYERDQEKRKMQRNEEYKILDKLRPSLTLPMVDGVTYVSLFDTLKDSTFLQQQGFITYDGSERFHDQALFQSFVPISTYKLRYNEPNYHYTISCNLHIEEHTDHEILEAIKTLLPIWRKKTGYPEPQKILQKPSDMKRVVKYKLIPLLDLKSWANIEKVKIENRVLVTALFPDGEYGENNLTQTIMPFLKKVTNPKYVRDIDSKWDQPIE